MTCRFAPAPFSFLAVPSRIWSKAGRVRTSPRNDRSHREKASAIGTASSPARVSTSARWNQGVGKTLSGYPLATRMEVATWPSSSAASSGPNAPIFKTPPSLKSITGGRRLSSSRRTAMRARENRRAGCANATPSRSSSPVSLGERKVRRRSRRRRRRWRRLLLPPRGGAGHAGGPGLWARHAG